MRRGTVKHLDQKEMEGVAVVSTRSANSQAMEVDCTSDAVPSPLEPVPFPTNGGSQVGENMPLRSTINGSATSWFRYTKRKSTHPHPTCLHLPDAEPYR